MASPSVEDHEQERGRDPQPDPDHRDQEDVGRELLRGVQFGHRVPYFFEKVPMYAMMSFMACWSAIPMAIGRIITDDMSAMFPPRTPSLNFCSETSRYQSLVPASGGALCSWLPSPRWP